MSLHAALLVVAGDAEGAEAVPEPMLPETGEWSPMPWARQQAANDDVLVDASPEFHSSDSGIGWGPRKAG